MLWSKLTKTKANNWYKVSILSLNLNTLKIETNLYPRQLMKLMDISKAKDPLLLSIWRLMIEIDIKF